VVKQISKRAIEGEGTCFFDVLQLVDDLESTRQVRNSGTHRVKSEQLAIGEPCAFIG